MKKQNFLLSFTMITSFGFSQIGANFNEPIVGTTNYFDPDIINHVLDNNCGGQPTIVYTYSAGSKHQTKYKYPI
jgi:hypothetical protein